MCPTSNGFWWVLCIVYGTRNYLKKKKTLKLDLTVLFTCLKIILLQYFQFLVISGIQTDPRFS